MQASPKRLLLSALLAMALLLGCATDDASLGPQLKRVRVSQFHMGMMVHLTVWAPTIKQGKAVLSAAFERIGQIDQIMSDYEPDSELTLLSRKAGKGPVAVSQELYEVLSKARHLAELTDGLYDPTVGPLSLIWREARQTNRRPERSAIDDALKLVNYKNLRINDMDRTVELMQPGMKLDLGSIAKGFAGDEAIKTMKNMGLNSGAYEAGGDKVFGNAPPGEKGWQIETGFPEISLPPLANCAVSISSDSVQFVRFDRKRFGHILDTKLGWAESSEVSCVVVASQGIDSDPLATVGVTMPIELFQSLLQQHFPETHSSVTSSGSNVESPDPRIPPL